MKSKKIKILICFIIIISITLISACARDNNNNDDNNDNNNKNGVDNDNNNDNNNDENTGNNENGNGIVPTNPNQDVDLTEKLLADEEIMNGQIYLKDEWAVGAIILNDSVSKERAQEIAQQYAEEIKEKYNDKKVNVQVILDGENVANIEL